MVNSTTQAPHRGSRDDETVLIVPIAGELDICTVPQLWARVAGMIATGVPVALDVNGLTFIDACGLSGLLTLEAAAAQHGRPLLVAGFSPALDRLLGLTGMPGRFPAPAETLRLRTTQPVRLGATTDITDITDIIATNLPHPA
ncbi:MAG: STAS domain-containing protein [Streptosporangiales bacterium]|nr:STAS domain-containing protein [Streptosporangiales bacterium]